MEWDHPFNVAIITVEEVLVGERDVLLVMHEDGHGGWQFYDGQDTRGRKPSVVPREEILAIDPSLVEITDLPVGWLALRTEKGAAWDREQIPK